MHGMNIAKRTPDIKKLSYTDDLLDELEVSLSRERLGTYLDTYTLIETARLNDVEPQA